MWNVKEQVGTHMKCFCSIWFYGDSKLHFPSGEELNFKITPAGSF